jgi:tetratricopeptide (TPR) repeat protein
MQPKKNVISNPVSPFVTIMRVLQKVVNNTSCTNALPMGSSATDDEKSVKSRSMRVCTASTRAVRSTNWARLLLAFAWAVAAVFYAARAQAEAEPGGDAALQKLYQEAKEAEASGNTTAAVLKYKEILRIAPKLGSAYNNLGLLYFKQRDYDKAVSTLEQGIKVNPAMPSAYALLGISLSELGRYAEARGRLEEALRRNPKDNDAEKVLANDLSKLGDLEASAAHLRALSHRQPQDQEAWYLLGQVYMRLSEQALSKMNAINPDSELVHEMSGEIMENMKNYDGALLEYKKAADMAPQKSGVHYKLGNVYWTIAQWDAATNEFQAELASNPRNCKAQALIGDILIDQKMEFERGLTEVEKALAICPNLVQGRIDRGRALLKLNRTEEAAKDLQAAAQASPDDPGAHFFLAQAYRVLGRTKDAQAEMQTYSKLEESARASQAARARELIENKEAPH